MTNFLGNDVSEDDQERTNFIPNVDCSVTLCPAIILVSIIYFERADQATPGLTWDHCNAFKYFVFKPGMLQDLEIIEKGGA
jgi:hypothetical protein